MSSLTVGVDVGEARKGFDVVVLDGLDVVDHLGRRTAADLGGVVRTFEPALVCIDAPSGWAASGRSRASERALRRLGITCFCTPTDPGDHPFYRWMRAGFLAFEAVAATHPVGDGTAFRGVAAEVFPEATARILAGRRRAAGESKVAFRRAVLAAAGVDQARLPNLDRVDAALAALTGQLALTGRGRWIGDPAEGMVLLPDQPGAETCTSPGGRSRSTSATRGRKSR